jgi:hypothetical protein
MGQRAQFTFDGIAGRRYALRGERLTGSGCIFGFFRINKPTSGTLPPNGDTCGTTPFVETVVVADPGRTRSSSTPIRRAPAPSA